MSLTNGNIYHITHITIRTNSILQYTCTSMVSLHITLKDSRPTVSLSKLKWTNAQADAVFANLRNLHSYTDTFHYSLQPTASPPIDVTQQN